ncbi:ComF family protein [Limosilactobacillus sp.]|jgi:competence protein ComFC|uniref:ComF family protein n=1 Tax=Limosilactobacillus sp. TaxID=2773925 RepID=UPI0025C1E40F|nr:ComF family protein [Limosilactobacillus sp.]MCH3922167.1 ComF family protein [Limosilactobacillus sp.]MCH3928938.1 ComF family protein [Limosilactobacillus sp.]
MNCLLCNAPLTYRLTIPDLVLLRPIQPPLVCQRCSKQFVHIDPCTACPGCGRPKSAGRLCPECQRWHQHYGWHLHHTALYTYNEAMRDFMRRYKFQGDYHLRRVFQNEFFRHVREAGADLVIPIPVTTTTMATRGFNQVLGLLGMEKEVGLLVHRAGDKVAQSHKTRQQRLHTPQPFQLANPAAVRGKRVLLVDDVYTTGRTLYHAASLIHAAGGSEVCSLSLAR